MSLSKGGVRPSTLLRTNGYAEIPRILNTQSKTSIGIRAHPFPTVDKLALQSKYIYLPNTFIHVYCYKIRIAYELSYSFNRIGLRWYLSGSYFVLNA